MRGADLAALLSALIDDVEAMRVHDARLAEAEQRARVAAALRALSQTEAFRAAAARQSVAATRLFLEGELARRRPPQSVGRDAAIWALVREHLERELRALPR